MKVMTIHQAQGPRVRPRVRARAWRADCCPSTRIQQNPAERGKSLDFELRGRRRRSCPPFDGTLSHFKDDLQGAGDHRGAPDRLRRADPRAEDAASWRGASGTARTSSAKEASPFFDELVGVGQPEPTRPTSRSPARPTRTRTRCSATASVRARLARAGAPRRDRRRCSRAGGDRRARRRRACGGVQASLVDALAPDDRSAFEWSPRERRALSTHLLEREARRRLGRRRAASRARSRSSGVIDYARCPKRFYWSTVRPLPRFSGPAARIGTEIHRWIERRASGQAAAAGARRPARPHAGGAGRRAGPGRAAPRRRSWRAGSPTRPRCIAERPFLLRVGGFTVGGRIDAIYGEPDGPWEVVDWKTGRRPADDDPSPAPARRLRARVRRDLGQAARGPDADVRLPRERRRGHPPHGRARRRSATGSARRSTRSASGCSTRSPACSASTATSRRSAAPARPGSPRTARSRRGGPPTAAGRSRLRSTRRQTLDLLAERPVVGRGVVPARRDPRNDGRRQPRLGGRPALGHGSEPLEVAGLQDHLAVGPETAERRVVGHHGRPPERMPELRAELLVVGTDAPPRRRPTRPRRASYAPRHRPRRTRPSRVKGTGGPRGERRQPQPTSERDVRRTCLASPVRRVMAISGSSRSSFMNRCRWRISRVIGVSEVTVAVRTSPSRSEISPK